MKTDSTRDKPFACEAWSEHQASLALNQSKKKTKQDGLKAVNHKTINDEGKRKRSVNQYFWYRVWVGCNILLVMIIIYAAYKFFVR